MQASPTERKALRRRILAARHQLTPSERHRKSAAIQCRLWEVEAFRTARTVLLYAAFRSEVETMPVLTRCLQSGKQVCFPLTRPAPPGLEPYAIADPDQDLQPGYCGIPEPRPDRTVRVPPREIEAVVVPGAVFDRQGGRLGYGGGFYDRFLAEAAPQAVRIGLAFDLQVVAAVPLLAHDQLLDWLVTETTILETASRPSFSPEGLSHAQDRGL